MQSIKDKIILYLNKYNTEIKCDDVFRRGLCGHLNLDTILKKLINDLKLQIEIIKTSNGKEYEVYKSSSPDYYVKILCVCDKDCKSNCGIQKTKQNCDGHRLLLISKNNTMEINDEQDYIIDFTYKQMLYSIDEEQTNLKKVIDLNDYLFIPYLDYLNYSTNSRWQQNITNPCKVIIDNKNSMKQKYLKYKKKYIDLKNQIGGML